MWRLSKKLSFTEYHRGHWQNYGIPRDFLWLYFSDIKSTLRWGTFETILQCWTWTDTVRVTSSFLSSHEQRIFDGNHLNFYTNYFSRKNSPEIITLSAANKRVTSFPSILGCAMLFCPLFWNHAEKVQHSISWLSRGGRSKKKAHSRYEKVRGRMGCAKRVHERPTGIYPIP